MQSVDFISYGGETLALCAAIPDWSQPMKVDIELPTQVTDSLLKNESRRRFATSQRYTLEHLFTSDNTGDSHDMRAWLNRLKKETVAVPLWMDEVELGTACAVHATTLDIIGQQPVRSGSEWLITDEEGTDYEIVVVTDLTASTMTLSAPGTSIAWPAGTLLYPLMFGRLTDRPQVESASDETLSGTFSFKENSPYARKLTPRVSPASLVGSHVPDFALYKLWTVEPDWSKPIDWTEADILYHQIGFGREEQAYQYQNWNRRGLEMQFTCTTRDEISEVEYFFNERKATTLSFFIPTFRGDLRLAADVADGATTFQIEPSRYEIASYDQQPWNAFLAFIDDSGIYPQRITLVNATTITPEVPVGKAFDAETTNVSFLSLVRLAEPKLSWEYLTDGTARTKLKFIELPSEYTAPGPSLHPIAYLYRFTEVLTGVPNEWFFTSHEDAIDFDGKTYTPAPFSHGRYKASRDLSDPFELTSWGGDFTGNPLNLFLPYVLNGTMTLTVFRVNRDNPDDTNQRQLYYGDVMDLDATGPDWKANLKPFGRRLEQKFPRKLLQVPDNYTQFTTPTQLSTVAFNTPGTIAAISGFNLTVPVGASFASDYFSGGWITTGTGANFERRTILKSVTSGTSQTFTLDRPLVHAIIGQTLAAFPGYDQSRTQCDSKFNNNINFGGYPFMPDTNPSIEASEIVTPTGGKK